MENININDILAGITIQSAWMLIALFLVLKAVIGSLEHFKNGTWNSKELVVKSIEDLKWLAITYALFYAYIFTRIEVFNTVAKFAVAIIVMIELKKITTILLTKAKEEGVNLDKLSTDQVVEQTQKVLEDKGTIVINEFAAGGGSGLNE